METTDIKNIIVVGLVRRDNLPGQAFLLVEEPDGAIRFPGGKVKGNESLVEALRREINEETGLDASVDQMVCIEYAAIWEEYAAGPSKSVLIYFFNAALGRQTGGRKECVVWLDKEQIASLGTIPYDNLLISKGMSNIKTNNPYIVPPGFRDFIEGPGHVSTRTFCWINKES